MNATITDVATNRLWVVEQALSAIMTAAKDAIPIKGFTQAPARLKRLGISHLVTLEDDYTGKEEIVPLRVVDDSSLIHSRFCTTEELVSWRGKLIHAIGRDWSTDLPRAIRKVRQCLKTAWNRFQHKLEKSFHRLNVRTGRYRPWRARKDRTYRYESARMCH